LMLLPIWRCWGGTDPLLLHFSFAKFWV
jgi:hypothetical protein